MELSEMKVLVCDDSILVRKKFKDILTALGVTEIFEASDGQKAVEMFSECSPDVIFMDIVMPVKSGIEALEDIKLLDSNAKVVMASTIGTQSNLATAIKAGAYDFLQKPVTTEQVEKILNGVSRE